MKINTLSITGFKSIKDQKIDFSNINILIGANGVGKSNLIQFFKLLNKIVSNQLQNFVADSGGLESIFYFGLKNTTSIDFNLWFGNNGYECELKPAQDGGLFFSKEIIKFLWDNGSVYKKDISKGNSETKLFEQVKIDGQRVAWYVTTSLISWIVYHFHDTSATAKVKLASNVDDNRILRPDASNLAAFLYLMQQKNEENLRLIENTIKIIAPFFDRFDLKPLERDSSQIRLEWKHTGSDLYFNANHLSDGTLRMICLITLLLQPRPPHTVIIDEPELGLHPAAITLLADLIKSVSQKAQVVCSTQSVTLLNQFGPEDIIIVERKENESVFSRLDRENLESWMEDYSLGEIWEKNIIGGRP